MYQLSIIRNTSECPYLPARVQMANAQILFGLCWSPTLAGIREYLATGNADNWSSPDEQLVIHNQRTGKMYTV